MHRGLKGGRANSPDKERRMSGGGYNNINTRLNNNNSNNSHQQQQMMNGPVERVYHFNDDRPSSSSCKISSVRGINNNHGTNKSKHSNRNRSRSSSGSTEITVTGSSYHETIDGATNSAVPKEGITLPPPPGLKLFWE